MNSASLDFLGVFVRYLYIKFIKKKNIRLIKLWEKTRFDENLEYLKITNKMLGLIFAIIITLLILIIVQIIPIS